MEFIKDYPIEKLKIWEQNPRKNDKSAGKLVDVIQEYGFINPIIIDQNGIIRAGHTRLKAANRLHQKTVPVLIHNFKDEAQAIGYSIADNKSAEWAEWDFDELSGLMKELEEQDFDISLTGFEESEMDDFRERSEIVEAEVPEVPEVPITKTGDIWLLGNHRVMCGDSTVGANVFILMDGKKADIFVTDPPYNVSYHGHRTERLAIKSDTQKDDNFRKFLKNAFENAVSVLKDGGVFYIWCTGHAEYDFRDACKDAGLKVRQTLIWIKNLFVIGRQDYHWKHETCLYGWKEGAAHLWASDRKQTTIMNFDRPQKSLEHPTMKPVALFAYQISNNTKRKDIALDLFLGSGTLLIASEQTGRVCYGMELDEHYCDVIVQRYINLKESDGDVFLIRNGEKIKYSDV